MVNEPTYEKTYKESKHLLVKTAGRKLSTIFETANETFEGMTSLWQIKVVNQLTRWVEDDAERVFDMLNQLRQERDLVLNVTEIYKDVYEDFGKHKKEIKGLHNNVASWQETSRVWEQNALTVQEERDLLKKENELFKSEVKDFNNQGARPSRPKTKKTPKLPDLPIFINGMDFIWTVWSVNMEDKLAFDGDLYDGEAKKIIYVLSRLGGDAAEHCFFRKQPKAINPYKTAQNVIEQLRGIHENPNERNMIRREYNTLKQGIEPFNVFYQKISRLINRLGISNEILQKNMTEKLNKRLKEVLSHISPGNMDTFAKLRFELQHCDSQQRFNFENRKKEEELRSTPISRRSTNRSLNKKPSILLVRTLPTTTTTINAPNKCFAYGENGHMVKDCPKNTTDSLRNDGSWKKTNGAPTVKMAELNIDKQYELDHLDDPESFSEDSENE